MKVEEDRSYWQAMARFLAVMPNWMHGWQESKHGAARMGKQARDIERRRRRNKIARASRRRNRL